MANRWGNILGLSIFGESHGKSIGIILDGIPPGEVIDIEDVLAEMKRRAPGQNRFSTARNEADFPEIQSGFINGRTTGSPLCALINNKDARSKDYSTVLRPGHADMTALQKYHSHADMRGGGHFSGRLTAPIVFAGAVAKQILKRRGVQIYARISAVYNVKDEFSPSSKEMWATIQSLDFPCLNEEKSAQMQNAILEAKSDGDSVGGVIEAAAFGVPAGLGSPFFRPLESTISSILFSVPAVKGVEFGAGFSFSSMRGSQANDSITAKDGRLFTTTNNNGGILGGISNCMPVTVKAAIKPTPSIAKPQQSVDGITLKPTVLQVTGRHDPCIVQRAVPVIEACLALSILDHMLESGDVKYEEQ